MTCLQSGGIVVGFRFGDDREDERYQGQRCDQCLRIINKIMIRMNPYLFRLLDPGLYLEYGSECGSRYLYIKKNLVQIVPQITIFNLIGKKI